MAANKAVWGIDLGQCALKAIKLRLAGDKVEVIDHVYIEHKRILSQPDVDRQALITDAVKKFTEHHDLSKETLVVGVPGQNTLARFTKLPPVPDKKIPEIVKYEAQQQIPFDMEEVIWDYQTFEDPVTKEKQVGIFAMRRELLRNHLTFLSSENYEPAIVQSSPLALYNALKYDGIVGAEPICILDIGAQNTDLIVVDGDSLWTRNIPIGGNNFTDALLKTFKLSFNKSENLKRTAASSKYARQIFQAMRPVFADLVAEVQRSIGFFTSSRRGVKLNKVLAMGNAFKLPGMTKFVQQNLGMDVIRPTAFNKLVATEDPKAPELMDQLLSFAVAYGLALQGLGKAPITSNLLPPEIAKQVVWRKKTPWFYGAAACLAAAAGLVWMRNSIDSSAVTAARGSAVKPNYPATFAPEDKEQKNPLPNQEAVRFVQSGTSTGTPVEFSNQVVAAAQSLSQVQQQIEGRNADRITEATELSNLMKEKLVWPRLIEMLHNALPKGDKDLNEAMKQGAKQVKALIASNPEKYERGKREKIFIEKLQVEYSPDVNNALLAKKNTAAPGSAGAGVADPDKEAGFVITVTGRTPFQGKNPGEGGVFFVTNTFVKALQKAAMPGIYFDKVATPYRQTPHVKTLRSASGQPGGRQAGGFFAGQAGGGGAQPGTDGELDVSTGEKIDDTEFEMAFVAILKDKPADQPAPSATPTPGEAPTPPAAGG